MNVGATFQTAAENYQGHYFCLLSNELKFYSFSRKQNVREQSFNLKINILLAE